MRVCSKVDTVGEFALGFTKILMAKRKTSNTEALIHGDYTERKIIWSFLCVSIKFLPCALW